MIHTSPEYLLKGDPDQEAESQGSEVIPEGGRGEACQDLIAVILNLKSWRHH